MSENFTVTIKATSITVYPGEEAMCMLQPLLDMLTYEDEFVEEEKTLGFLYDSDTDTLYLHRGVDLNYLKRLLVNVEFVNKPYHKYREMCFEYEEIIAPRDNDQVDVINFIAGLNQHSNNLEQSQLFLVKKPGFGKAQPYSTKIPTPTEQGYTLMGDLKVGDYVFDRTGNKTKILQIFEQGEKDVYKITFNDSRIAYSCMEHLWTVRTANGNYRTMQLKDILNDYKHISRWKVEHGRDDPYSYKYYIPACSPVKYPHKNVPIDPWVLGCFIGNGCCLEKYLTISSPNDLIPLEIGKIYGFTIKKLSVNNYSYRFCNKDGSYVKTEEFFGQLSKYVCVKSFKKSIPESYIINDIETRLSLLQGLMDTDGTVTFSGGRFSTMYTSTSEKLLNQLKTILYSFGFSGTIVLDKRSNKYSNGFCGVLVFRIPNKFKSLIFRMDYKKSILERETGYKQNDSYGRFLIKDISFSHREQCRCIMVDNPEHLYLTEDYIVTHNTYCSGVGLCKYKVKTLIIMHRDSLRKQWLNSLYNMSGLSSKYVHEIATSEELCRIAKNEHNFDYDVYLMTHATFRAGIKRIPKMEYAMRITKNLGIGMKIIDEAHLEFRDTILMDMIFNVKRNLYLTATDGRSSKDENAIFRHVFSNALFYKPSSFLTDNLPKKWVEYIAVSVNSHCNPNIYRYRVAGGRGMNNASYGRWVIAYDKKKTHLNCCKDILKVIYDKDPHAKILLFMPLIDLCEECSYFLKRELGKDPTFDYDLDIRTINSKNSKRDNEYAKKADVIVTTIASCGTGTDIPGITGIISCSPYVSGITAEQVFGRIRYCGKVCQYYDIYDVSVQLDVFWWKSRSKKLKHLALNTSHLSWEPEVIDNDQK